MTHPTDAVQATCPEPTLLAAFVDRRLDDARRRAVEAHLVDCAACRDIVIESTELLDELVAPAPRVVSLAVERDAVARRWTRPAPLLALAASIVLVTAASWWYARTSVDVVGLRASLVDAVRERPYDARFNAFAYAPVAPVLRSAERRSTDPGVRAAVATIEQAAGRSSSPEARALLAVAFAVDGRLDDAREAIDEALAHDPSRADWHADRAAILLALAERGNDAALDDAIRAADRAVAIAPAHLAALFNRALALDLRADVVIERGGAEGEIAAARAAAVDAWTQYLVHDSSSPWAEDARTRLERRRASTTPRP